MKNQTEKDNYFPDMSQRFCDAELVVKEKVSILLEVNDSKRNYVSQVRINESDIDIQSLTKGNKYKIFLIRPNEKGLWFASLKWNQPNENPWFHTPYSRGGNVSGIAVRYIKDHTVIIKLTDGIEAYLHIDEVKNISNIKSDNIRDIILIGDMIYGEIIHFSKDHLECNLSIENMYEKKKKDFYNLKKLSKDKISKKTIKLIQPSAVSYPNGITVLIIDDNRFFRNSLKNWFKLLGTTCKISLDPTKIQSIIEKETNLYIILDYDLENNSREQQIQDILSSHEVPVLVCSAHDKAAKLASDHNWFYSMKPISYEVIDAFLSNNNEFLTRHQSQTMAFDIHNSQLKGMWRAELPEIISLQDKITQFLERLCYDIRFSGALWIKEKREGVFTIQAYHGIDSSSAVFRNLQSELVHTIVSNVMKDGNLKIVSHEKSSPRLKAIAPDGCCTIIAFPLHDENMENNSGNDKTEEVLLFFSPDEMDAQTIETQIQPYLPVFHRFIENFQLLEHIEELQAFAPLGLGYSGLIHELSNSLNPMYMITRKILQSEQNEDLSTNQKAEKFDQLHNKVSLFNEEIKKMRGILSTRLLMTRKKKRKQYILQDMVKQVTEILEQSIEKHRNKIDFRFELPDEKIKVSLPRKNIEQPLINLILNAIYQVQEQKWGEIVIRMKLHTNNPQTPIHISVEDNGKGINADEMQILFKPRATSRSLNGNGLGLLLSRKMVELIGGKIENPISHRWYKTIFTMKLPVNFLEVK